MVAALPDHSLQAPVIAEAMVAEENLPMYGNNVRLASDAERLELASRTVAVWHELRSQADEPAAGSVTRLCHRSAPGAAFAAKR